MDYKIDYKPKNKITNFCEFLVEEKTMEQNKNVRGRMVSTLLREYRCLKTGRMISIYNNCDECENYIYYPEIIEQQAKRISELEAYIHDKQYRE